MNLHFKNGYSKNLSHNSFVFFATTPKERITCIVAIEEVEDFHQVTGLASAEKAFDLWRAQECAERAYSEGKLRPSGELPVTY